MSDGGKVNAHCGVGLCVDNSTSSFCSSLECATNYSHCPVVAAARCDGNAVCHGFALYKTPWRDYKAQFFAKGTSGLVPQSDWTAYTKPNQQYQYRENVNNNTSSHHHNNNNNNNIRVRSRSMESNAQGVGS
jgi:hypothetical protein